MNSQGNNPAKQFNPPKTFRDEMLKWNGWGYNDSYFTLSPEKDVFLVSERYKHLNDKIMPQLRPWIEQNVGIDLDYKTPSISLEDLERKWSSSGPQTRINETFLEELRTNNISYSNALLNRLNRSHGQTLHEILSLRQGNIGRIPDLVVWPKNEHETSKVVAIANELDIALIPFGGGTSVSDALNCPENEQRLICSLDMSLINKIIYIDENNRTCRAQAGIIGQDLERQLNEKGFTCGHEPDSVEFSTLGGWISTRASGMKKNKYGNIEVPRISSGPDLHEIVLGSEGTYGVITEATIKIFPMPERAKYGSIIFPDFSFGVAFFREVAKQRCQCASLRLVDNVQFIMGQAMKVLSESIWHGIQSAISKLYITRWKGFDIHKMVAATCVFEGSVEEVEQQSKKLFAIASKYGGVPGGEENGLYGYRLTFAIAYLRDLAMEYSVIGESFETSIPWDKVESVCRNVKVLLQKESARHGVKYPIVATCRVTQVYDAGACVYFYFGFNYRDLQKDPIKVYEEIEIAARKEILACGGSISHHHGVGKLRKQFMASTVGFIGISLLKSIKHEIDPNNVFASNNLIDSSSNNKI
ncbi:FAD binding domain-containing protein [Ditylenchus destructor]|uniref:Alkylglycerone-phosphate synthase n=1 Tax=Ditylenchus destructor TaxID=166010 RepID=A0AAD4NBL4_9BILA|nr:FAD binding domain-containing protein [Ditylenchus destructor]